MIHQSLLRRRGNVEISADAVSVFHGNEKVLRCIAIDDFIIRDLHLSLDGLQFILVALKVYSPAIKSISFENCNITTEHMKLLGKMLPKDLRRISLCRNNITDDGLCAFRDALAVRDGGSVQFRYLDLINFNNNCITDRGVGVISSLFEHHFSGVEEILLDLNEIDKKAAELFKNAIDFLNIQAISLKHNKLSTASLQALIVEVERVADQLQIISLHLGYNPCSDCVPTLLKARIGKIFDPRPSYHISGLVLE
ncbi:hypothetical protein ADUPG1_013293 [Aduncisulcus paluster]|nr:hypothetical protein ADUPG1_013293 [Aduncisulcus paluster]